MKRLFEMKLILPLAFATGFFLTSTSVNAQDMHFSQYLNSPLSLNPSLAGAYNGSVRLQTNYRNQWSSISAPYKTYSFSSDFAFIKDVQKKGHLGLGISFFSDKAGTSNLSTTQINVTLAFHEKISAHSILSAGIQGGFAQRSIDFDNLKWDSQYNGFTYDPNLPSYETNYNNNLFYPDLSGGIQWNYSKREMFATANNQHSINAGIAIFHMNRPNISFYSFSKDALPVKVVVYGNAQIGSKNSKYSFLPSMLYMLQGSMKNIIFGGMIRKKLVDESKYTGYIKGAAIAFGGLYRLNDAFIPVAQIEFANYALGLSYDVNTSDLTKVSLGKGGFEISLKFVNPNPFTGRTVSIKNPRFFN